MVRAAGPSTTTEGPPRAVRRARWGVAALFFTNGALFANLVPRYPELLTGLELSNTSFGAAIAAYPLGALVAGLSAGALIRRFRSARVAVTATALTASGLVVAGWASAWAVLAVGMLIAGALDAISDVAQNAHGLRVQERYRRSILNGFHAVWSIAAVVGGLMGAGAAALGVPLRVHVVVVAVLFAALALASSRLLLPGPEPVDVRTDAEHREPRVDVRAVLARAGVLLALVVVAGAGAVVEDAGSTWAAIYLAGDLGATTLVAGLGFVALQGAQVVGRLSGDALVDRFGQRAVARAGGVLVLAGTGAALAAPSIASTIAGFAVAGLGIATLIPAAMRDAERIPGLRPGTGLTVLSWLLRAGFLLSPPLVGAIADTAGLRIGLLSMPIAGALVLVFARVLTADRRPSPA